MSVVGILFIVSAPSGAGKTSLLKELIPNDTKLTLSVSHTTRAMRSGEEEGTHYHFTEIPAFEALVSEGAFVEHAKVFDNYYGTSENAVRDQLNAGKDVVVEIDWQGAQQVRERFTEAVSIFILPPSIEALRERLGGRGQDSEATIDRRMQDARSELSHYSEYDYLVINDVFATALDDLDRIVSVERLGLARQSCVHADAIAGMLAE